MGSYQGAWVSWRLIRITRPTSPGELARRNNVPAKLIAQVNPLPEGHSYAVGATLLIPLKNNQIAEEIPQQLARGASLLTHGAGQTQKAPGAPSRN
jgi:hypothetical protein